MYGLQLASCNKSFSQTSIISGLSLDFRGFALGIAGRNGSGKSTLLKILSGQLRFTSGSMQWTDPRSRPLPLDQVLRTMGFCAPYLDLYPDLDCMENLRFINQLRSEPADEDAMRRALLETGFKWIPSTLYRHLSSGQKQRARLAAAVFFDPPMLFLDEPGTNLDESGIGHVTRLVQKRRANGRLTVLASNSPSELELCESLIRLGAP
jgi:ABC-type multidrug transport system ATPase subunit